jgi:co-chaperonin GroES (HSP10)
VELNGRELVVVGDRVLMRPEDGDSVTNAGLILPASVADRDSVQAGRIVAVGPGTPMAPTSFDFDEEWRKDRAEPRWVVMQARVGDVALFYRKAAVEVSVDQQKYVIVSHAAILLLLRGEASPGSTEHAIN